MTKLRTHEQARAHLSHQGISIAQWAREHGYNYSIVLEVLAGRKKCSFGASHNIAVALGMKQGVATSRPGRELHRAGQANQRAGAAA
jgi:gp16 family phage-associated protein